MSTSLRSATLLDILGVLDAMTRSERGMAELHQYALLGGSTATDLIAASLMKQSRAIFAMVDDTQPWKALSVAGFIPTIPGTFQTWMLTPDETWTSHGVDLTKHTADGLTAALEQVHRIETYCLDSHERAKRWYARIGLHKETTLASYCTDGQDAALFVLTRGKT